MDHKNQGSDGHHHDHSHSHGDSKVPTEDLTYFFPKIIAALRWGQEKEAVLDYGCGPGSTGFNFILPQLVKYNSKLYSVDVNEKKIESAKATYKHENVVYAVGNIMDNFPFDDIKFDKIFSIYVFHFVPDLKQALSRLHDILKPGGQMAFTMHKTSYFNILKSLTEMDKWKQFAGDCENFSSEFAYGDSTSSEMSFKSMAEEVGFKVLLTDSKEMEMHIHDMDGCLSSRMTNFPFIDKVPAELKSDLKEDFRTVLTNTLGIPRDSKKFIWKYQCIAVVCEKAL